MSRSAALSLVALLFLTACASSGTEPVTTPDRAGAVNAAIDQAARQSGNASNVSGESEYKRASTPQNALRYSNQLRRAGDYTKAAAVLSSFANAPDASADVKREYAALQLELGNYPSAIKYAQGAIALEPTDGTAYQLLGIAQDAQGDHVGAEKSFRQALTMWKGDRIPVMNNLALSLANQNRVDEAVALLQQAKQMDPNRVEIERNLRIISTLNEKVDYRQPNTGAAMPDIYGKKNPTAAKPQG
jgi:Flp pilus assembly protein TadD